ncbi:MAG: hypothetical protein IJ168_04305 [Eubacterium sp.]|nr:hypothetical protein [Eubacterium sp.]
MKVMKILAAIAVVFSAFFAVTFTVYWFNADMKLVRVFYEKMQPHYDNLKKDRKL